MVKPLIPVLITLSAMLLVEMPTALASVCRDSSSVALGDRSMTLLRVEIENSRGTILSEALSAYQIEQGLYLPLGELMQALEFPITIGSDGVRAEGWFLDPDRTFALDAAQCLVTLGHGTRSVERGMIRLRGGEIYVHQSLIELWFPLELTSNLKHLALTINPLEPLPVQQRQERKSSWKQLEQHPFSESTDYAFVDTPYRLWDWPVLNATLDNHYYRRAHGREGYSSRYKLIGSGDALKMNARVSIAGNDDEPLSNVFMTLGRRDPDGKLLGPLQASELAIGDIVTSRDALITDNTLGRGLKISNFPLHRPDDFDQFTLQGELPPGWDVELYKNDQLIAFQSGGAEGRYDLTGIPLDFGINRFRMVFYGPQGEVREHSVQRLVGTDMTRPGAHHYRFTAIEVRDDLTGLGRDETGQRLSLDYEYGLAKSIGVGGSIKSLPLDGSRRHYLSAHTNLILPGAFGQVKYATEAGAGDAVSALISTRLHGFDIAAESSRYFNLETEQARSEPVPGTLLGDSELRISRYFPELVARGLGFRSRFAHRRGTQGEVKEADSRLLLNTRYGSFSHVYETRRFNADIAQWRRTRQRLFFSSRWNALSLRGEVIQELAPEKHVSNIGVSGDWTVDPHTRLHLGVNRSPDADSTSYALGVSRLFGGVALSANLSASDQGSLSAGISVSSNLVRNPSADRWSMSTKRQTQAGAVAVRVFLDSNGDGVRDSSERAVEGVMLNVSGQLNNAKTDADGRLFVSGLPAHRRMDIAIDPDSLDNPFWRAEDAGRSIVPRPGRTATIELPVTNTGGVEGRAYWNEPEGSTPASDLTVSLIDMNGELIHQSRSAYDGYYNFDRVTPGYYRLRVGSAELDRPRHALDVIIEIEGGEMIQDVALLADREELRERVADVRG